MSSEYTNTAELNENIKYILHFVHAVYLLCKTAVIMHKRGQERQKKTELHP